MPQAAIFGPVFATIFLTLAVWVYMYGRRISFITTNQITPNDLAVPGALAGLSPPEVANPSDNLKNLFEIPVIFYALALSASISTCSLRWQYGSSRLAQRSATSVLANGASIPST